MAAQEQARGIDVRRDSPKGRAAITSIAGKLHIRHIVIAH